MNCRRVVNLLSAYVDGELTGVEMLEIRRHLSDCSECAEEHQAVLFTKRALSELGCVVPRKDFVAQLMCNLDVVQISPYQRVINRAARYMHRRFSPVAAALAASGLAMVVLSAGGVMDGLGTPSNGTSSATPFANSSISASFLPDVQNGTDSIAPTKPLMVASDNMSMANARVEFVSLGSIK